MSEPTPGEIMRRLDANTSQLMELARQFREDRDRADQRYVPRVEWVEARKGIADRIDNVVEDVVELKAKSKDQAAFQRQVLLALAVAAFSAFVSVCIAVAGLVLGKGP